MPHSMWDLSFPIRDEPEPLQWKPGVLTIGPPREVPDNVFSSVLHVGLTGLQTSSIMSYIRW